MLVGKEIIFSIEYKVSLGFPIQLFYSFFLLSLSLPPPLHSPSLSQFVFSKQVPSSGREYGSVWLKVDGQPQNVSDTLISEGMVEVRQAGRASE